MANIPSEPALPETRERIAEQQASNMVPFDALERFAKSFEASARRWELVVYPSMFAFIVLAAYGFILIYSLANDVAKLASSMDTRMGDHMASLATNMKNLTINIDHMSSNLADVATSMDTMTVDMNKIALRMDKMASDLDTMEPLLEEIKGMNESMQAMTQAVHVMTNTMNFMQRDTAVMGSSIGRPLSFMNSFAPW
jgi:methyl-accepting chemotaxis protein